MEESYYERNREARCAYQREYYKQNKNKINQKRHLDEASDPDKVKKRLDYNKEYYRKNRKKLLAERAKRYQEIKKEREEYKKMKRGEATPQI